MAGLSPGCGRIAAFAVLAMIMTAACGGESDGGHAASDATDARKPSSLPTRLELGHPASPGRLAALDIDANPAGAGLPPGRGTHADGAVTYRQQCASCHGMSGEGIGSNPRLVGAEPRDSFPFGRDASIPKTVGNYWPYATTLYDYINRAMPYNAPGSLTPDQVYGLVAFLLAENGVTPKALVVDGASLPKVRMPARDRFVPDDRTGGAGFR